MDEDTEHKQKLYLIKHIIKIRGCHGIWGTIGLNGLRCLNLKWTIVLRATSYFLNQETVNGK